jgi:hypothetical protein
MSFNVPYEAKFQMLTQRIEALNLEGYQHELNRKSAEALNNEQLVQESSAAIATIQSAIAVHEAELADLS